jgi:hypothetical protein
MLSEIARKWKLVTAGLATATAVATLGAAVADPLVTVEDDDERPPIIVNNGSIEFEGDDGFLGLKDGGTWAGTGSVYTHRHSKGGPRYLQLKTSPNKKFCKVGTSTVLEQSPFIGSKIAITFGTSSLKWTVTASIVTEKVAEKDVNYLQLNFGNRPPTRSADEKRLTITDSERIYSVLIDEGSANAVRCDFPPEPGDPKVDLKILQKR